MGYDGAPLQVVASIEEWISELALSMQPIEFLDYEWLDQVRPIWIDCPSASDAKSTKHLDFD